MLGRAASVMTLQLSTPTTPTCVGTAIPASRRQSTTPRAIWSLVQNTPSNSLPSRRVAASYPQRSLHSPYSAAPHSLAAAIARLALSTRCELAVWRRAPEMTAIDRRPDPRRWPTARAAPASSSGTIETSSGSSDGASA
jgi:hypothetical protein